MTTCAWDGTFLAADRQATINGVRSVTTKIHKCGSFYYAMSGNVSDCIIVASWLRRGAKPSDSPALDEINSFGFAIKAGKVFSIEGRIPVLVPLDVDQFAAGSGREFAFAALALGKSAEEAVALASQYDICTGMGIQVVRVRRRGRSGGKR